MTAIRAGRWCAIHADGRGAKDLPPHSDPVFWPKDRNPMARKRRNKSETPIFKTDDLFEAYVSVAAAHRNVWDVTLDVFLKNPRRISTRLTRGDVMDIVAPH